ncbi:Nitrogen permease regulator 2 [Rhizophlyctis rosea]|nr:Nitrogen permease regulator 2 [Rhizophlyctis rosea]
MGTAAHVATRQIIPCIDGVQSVRRIADISDVDVTFVRIAIQHLLYYGCVKLVDIFQTSSATFTPSSIPLQLFSIRPNINRNAYDLLLDQTLTFVHIDTPPPPFATVFSLYCALKHGLTVQDWIEEHKVLNYNIDVRRFILYGVVKGFVYRVHKYPMWLTRADQRAVSESPAKYLKRYLKGQHHYDELCTMFGCSPKELDDILKSETAVRFIWK